MTFAPCPLTPRTDYPVPLLEQAKTSRGEAVSEGGAGASLKTTHRNAITCICAVPSGGSGGGGGGVIKFSTTAMDGQIAVWETSALNADLGGMRIT